LFVLIKYLKILSIAFLLFQSIEVMAQSSESERNSVNYSFKNFGSKEGLPLSSISCVLRDRFGLIWVGTSDGLYRFDGYLFEAFKFDPEDKTTISGNIVNCLLEDKEGNIWVGTDNGGLCVFDRKDKKFKRFPKLYWKKEMYKIQSISSLLQDSNGNIWFSNSQFQYFVLDNTTKEIHPLHYDLLERLPDYYRVTNMFEDKNKTIWFATQFGLYYSVSNNKQANSTFLADKIYKKIPEISFQGIQTNRNSSDSIYLITNDGKILSYNINTNAYKQEFLSLTNAINNLGEYVQSAIVDKSGNWWICTFRNGLFMLDNKTKQLHNFKHEIYNTNSLSYNFLNKIYEDATGLIWICTDGGGLDVLNPKATKFKVFQHNPFNSNSLSSNDVWSMYGNQELLLTGTSSGISYFDKASKRFKQIDFIEDGAKVSLTYNCIKRDAAGNYWVGTEGEGVLKLNASTGRLEKLVIENLKSLGISAMSVICLEFYNDEIWIGTSNEGLIRYNKATKMAKVYKHSSNPNSIAENTVTSLCVSDKKNLWISLRNNGVNRLDIEKEQFDWISTTSKTIGHLSSDVAVSIIEDSYGTIWVGTERGLSAINELNNKVYTFNKIPSGSIDIVYGIIEDKQHQMWISTNKGIYTFNQPTPSLLFEDPKKADRMIENSIRNFDDQDGLPSNEFNEGAYFIDSLGIIYFGGINGLVFFNPLEVKQIKSPRPYLYLKSFNVFEKRLQMDTILDAKKVIKLKYFENYFSIEFVSPSFLNPEKTKYKYILEGLDKTWTTAQYQIKIGYTNIPPGDYRFRIKVTDSDGKWSAEEKSVRIIISPPFWQTTYFYAISILVAFAILSGYTRLRERSLKREKRLLEEKVKMRTSDVLKQKEIVETKSAELELALDKISENINYSNKIKQAILPDIAEIKKLFPETFLIYNPKLVVSGDFYFFAKQETSKKLPKYAVIGIADASGHGVPGALMSVIGSTILNDIVNLKGITKPAHILDELQLGVKETLKINEKNNYDAENIACAMCKFDFENNQLDFAGSKMSIYIVRNQQLIELKGDRMLIGAGSANLYERFTEKVFQLQHGDYIYMSTDGFANQFGGQKGKKFKTNRMKEMLLSLHTTSHVIQKEQISQIFDNWKGSNERVDDLLIIGIRYSIR
jgi:ligand-binding sensor domain-containing protein/serine phosphatase RsbU (regulator of sigma subunit)